MNAAQSGIAIITDETELRGLAEEWDALWARVGGEHHASFDAVWLSWLHVAKPRGRALHCVVARERGRLVLVWPHVAHTRLRCTVLRPLGPGVADYTGLLQEPGPEAASLLAEAWRTLLRTARPDLTYLPYLHEGTPLFALASSEPGLLAAQPDQTACASLRNETDWASFSARLPPVGGRTPAAIERRHRKEGELAVRTLEAADREGLTQAIDWMLECKRAWAEHSGKRGDWLYAETYRNYLLQLVSDAERPPAAQLLMITLNGAPLASMIIGLGRSTAIGLINGYDPAYARLSTGKLLIAQAVKWALEHKLDFEFGVGGEPYKGYWSQGRTQRMSSFEIAHTRWGRVSTRIKALELEVKRRLKGGASDSSEQGKEASA